MTWYAIQTGLFSTAEAAQQRAEAYAQRGAPGFSLREGDRYRVLIAGYAQQTDAAAVRDRLAREQQVETCLYTWVCPAITLRLTGMAGQLDVAAAGLTLAESTAAQLRDEAMALDAGTHTLQDAQQLLREADDRITLWADTARKRFVQPYPPLVSQELDVAERWPSAYTALRQAAGEGAAALSAAMKVEAMRLYDQAVGMRAAMAG